MPAKNLRIGPAAGPRGPFGPLSAPFSPPGLWVEGPTAVKIGDEYLVYFDAYTTKHYSALRSRDLVKTPFDSWALKGHSSFQT